MGIFGDKNEGGMMDMIRCDESNYLVWKWKPQGSETNSTKKENAIRWGSSLRVKEGEVAVFVYKQKDGTYQDFIVGPFDEILKTANIPIISTIIGWGYDGGTPFQAEVYFINLSQVLPFNARVPYFDVFDPRFTDIGVKCSVQYQIIFSITDFREFIKVHRLTEQSIDGFTQKLRPILDQQIKSTVIGIIKQRNIPVVQIETHLNEINREVEDRVRLYIEKDFAIRIRNLSVSAVELDKEDEQYVTLKKLTSDITEAKTLKQNEIEIKTVEAQSEINIQNLKDLQQMNKENLEEQLRIQREELQRAQKLQTETNFIETHKLNIQTDAQKEVLKSAAENLGGMGNIDTGGGSGGGMNPAGMMTGMLMGGAMGNQMANMMNNLGNSVNSSNQNTPPPLTSFFVAVAGKQAGPFSMIQLQQLVAGGQLNQSTLVWKNGMKDWAEAGKLLELQSLFSNVPPPLPPTT
ncbi:MAG: SPFH domain-containing protein [Bacteroidota bacterium]